MRVSDRLGRGRSCKARSRGNAEYSQSAKSHKFWTVAQGQRAVAEARGRKDAEMRPTPNTQAWCLMLLNPFTKRVSLLNSQPQPGCKELSSILKFLVHICLYLFWHNYFFTKYALCVLLWVNSCTLQTCLLNNSIYIWKPLSRSKGHCGISSCLCSVPKPGRWLAGLEMH